MRAIVVNSLGGPEVLEPGEVPVPEPGPGDVPCRVLVACVNFGDTHWTDGTYPGGLDPPFIPGMSFAGRSDDGRRVCGLVGGGSYAERLVAKPRELLTIPDGLDEADAAAIVLHGSTAWQVLRLSGRLQKGESVVVQAAAGGVGSFAVQLAKRWGAGRVIAMASSPEKRDLATRLGADVAVDSRTPNLMAALLDANNGKPINLVLDVTGGPTFDQCLTTLGEGGRIVTLGTTSRTPARPINPETLIDGSRSVVGFRLRRPAETVFTSLTSMVTRKEITPLIGARHALEDARTAHEQMLARTTVGVQLLDVDP